jgi:hypothetical protein
VVQWFIEEEEDNRYALVNPTKNNNLNPFPFVPIFLRAGAPTPKILVNI